MTSYPVPPQSSRKHPNIKVLVCDDHHSVRQSYAMLLSSTPDIDVTGQASNGEEAVRLAAKQGPDVVLMDLSMPGMDGIEATRRIKTECPSVEIVVLTAHTTDEKIRQALQAGAYGYIAKGNTYQEIETAIREVAAGGSSMAPQVARKVLDAFNPNGHGHNLTDDEIRCVRALADHDHNEQIAAALNYSSHTVSGHLRSASAKLGVGSRNRVLAEAIRKGIIDLP